LIFVAAFTQSASNTTAGIRLNADTGSNYPHVAMSGSGGGAQSFFGTSNMIFIPFLLSAATPVFSTSQIMDYSATDKHKTVLVREQSTRQTDSSFATIAQASRWADTGAVTSLQIFMQTGNFNAGATFSLYGVIA
jgi:hypothetical protein